MKLTYRQIDFLLGDKTVQRILDKAVGTFGLNLYRLMNKIELEVEPLKKQIQKVINKYGQKDEKGDIIVNIKGEQQFIQIVPGSESIANKEIGVLMNEEIDINVDLIEFKVEEHPTITAKELLSIRSILKRE